uniref:Uncharacterized protein n=1 Tax=Haemonchus contortus TaxID=6289 RepID=A0A7I4YJ19_HAECO
MERLFLAFVIIGAVAVGQLIEKVVPVTKIPDTGPIRAGILIETTLPYDNQTVEEANEIRNNASKLGTVKELRTWNILGTIVCVIEIADTNCSEVQSWLRDIVRSKKGFTTATVTCTPMKKTNHYHYIDAAVITKKTMHKTLAELEPV